MKETIEIKPKAEITIKPKPSLANRFARGLRNTLMTFGLFISAVAIVNAATFGSASGVGGGGGGINAAIMDAFLGVTGTAKGAVVRAADGTYTLAGNICMLINGDATACAKALGYADPRWFGTNVCTSNFNVNNTTDDDTAEIQLALDTNVPVYIPFPGCKLANKLNVNGDRRKLFSFGSGQMYNNNFRGSVPYIFVPNNIWDNRATSLNCAIDYKGYDGFQMEGISVVGNFALVGTTGLCNTGDGSDGLQGSRPAGITYLRDVTFMNLGNGIGPAMVSYFDTDPVNDPAIYGGNTPCTPISTGGTGGYPASQANIHNFVYQIIADGFGSNANCFGMYANATDVRISNFVFAANAHNGYSTLRGFGGASHFSNGRCEYGGYGAGPGGSKTYYNFGSCMWLDSPLAIDLVNVSFDHEYGPSFGAGANAKDIGLTNIQSFGAGFNAGTTGLPSTHFYFAGARGITATNIKTQRNGVNTDYVATFLNGTDIGSVVRTPDYVNWSGAGGAATSSGATGQWQTAYFLLTNIGSNFTYNVPGVGKFDLPEAVYDAGNSSTAITLALAANGSTNIKVTATGNATVTMPAQAAGRRFRVRYHTGAGSFTAAFSGVEWGAAGAPTLTVTASRMDIFQFESDGTKWYGSVVGQGYTP